MLSAHLLNTLGLALSFAVAPTTAIPILNSTVLRAPIEGYSVAELSWDLEVHPLTQPGQKTSFNGTIQNAVAQALAINPKFLVHHGIDLTHNRHRDLSSNKLGDGKSTVASRQDAIVIPFFLFVPDRGNWFCHDRWWPAREEYIKEGIRYLRGISGKPSLGPGPASCGRVSCSHGAAIWWCNDVSWIIDDDLVVVCTVQLTCLPLLPTQNTSPFVLEQGYDRIADMADWLVSHCTEETDPWWGNAQYWVSGQVFMQANYNVIVRDDWSDGC